MRCRVMVTRYSSMVVAYYHPGHFRFSFLPGSRVRFPKSTGLFRLCTQNETIPTIFSLFQTIKKYRNCFTNEC